MFRKWDSLKREVIEEDAQDDHLGSFDHEMIDLDNQLSGLNEVNKEFLEIEQFGPEQSYIDS